MNPRQPKAISTSACLGSRSASTRFFWLVALFLGMNSRGVRELLLWIVALFTAILVHELGHAVMMRAFGLSPRIVLYGFGGLTIYPTSQLMGTRASGWREQILISLAGPGAGFLLAGAVLGIIAATGHQVELGINPASTFLVYFRFALFDSFLLNVFLYNLIFISLIWGAVNLMPIYPLDGGQISREICLRIDRVKGVQWSILLSIFTAGLFFLLGLRARSIFLMILFGYMVYSNWTLYQSYRRSRW